MGQLLLGPESIYRHTPLLFITIVHPKEQRVQTTSALRHSGEDGGGAFIMQRSLLPLEGGESYGVGVVC